MADPRREEKRRQRRKKRLAAERKKDNLDTADFCFRHALDAYYARDMVEAVRSANRALAIAPGHCPALELLGRIHVEAGRYPDAAYYFNQQRKHDPRPLPIYNCAVARAKMGRRDEALADFQQFLQAIVDNKDPQLMAPRVDAINWLSHLSKLQQPPAAAQPSLFAELRQPAKAPEELQEEPVGSAPPPPAEPPRVTVEFAAWPVPDFQNCTMGSLVDYGLRRKLHELRLAQNFEDLICLPSLIGVDSYVHQQETVRKVLRQFKGRALLADETGLGKTIEAGLTLKEYWARGMVRKALVLVPASLVTQWKGELSEKFGFSPVSPDGPEFRREPQSFWGEQPLIVASLAMARLEPHAAALTAVPWDLVIVDEAHCLKNRASANWKLVNGLQKRFLLMLTATPVENDLIELYNLITVLKPGLLSTPAEFRKSFVTPGNPKSPKDVDRLRSLVSEVMVRNTRAAVDVRLPPRVAAAVTVPPSAAEAELYEMVSRFVGERYRPTPQAMAWKWLQRQAGSSPSALARACGRVLAGEDGIRFSPSDRGGLESIQELAAQIADSGKGLQLGHMLAARKSKAVVFTEFVPTLEYLARVAERHSIRCALFHGGMSRAEKEAAVRSFREEVEVLLSTGSGGEGRNLQFADTVINFDLPWNPMRLEQRVGRVHRIGQTQEVFVFNFCQGGTIEEQLLRVLHDKINMFEMVVGEMDVILGLLEEGHNFADLVLELWLSAGEERERESAFDRLADKLIAAKQQYLRARELDEGLFGRDFEV